MVCWFFWCLSLLRVSQKSRLGKWRGRGKFDRKPLGKKMGEYKRLDRTLGSQKRSGGCKGRGSRRTRPARARIAWRRQWRLITAHSINQSQSHFRSVLEKILGNKIPDKRLQANKDKKGQIECGILPIMRLFPRISSYLWIAEATQQGRHLLCR